MEKSFAEEIINKYGEGYLEKIWNKDNECSPWDISWKADKDVIFNCIKNHEHSFNRRARLYWKTTECPICKKINNSVGIKHPDSQLYWSNLNTESVFDYSSASGYVAYWKCPDGKHDDFERSVRRSVDSNFECPSCRNIPGHPNYKNRLDLTGRQFGELIVDSFAYTKDWTTFWDCTCSCGKFVVKRGQDLVSGKIVTCGDRSIHRLGENNSNWRGGATEKNYSDRYKKEYAEWRKAAYAKDYYTCQCCGEHGGVLNAHHLRDFANYKDLRFDVSNSIVLCDSCHNVTVKGSFHNIYGTHGKTPEELEEYINIRREMLGIYVPFSIEEYLDGNIVKTENNNFEALITTTPAPDPDKTKSGFVKMKPRYRI